MKRKYGWVRDLPDKRDLRYSVIIPETLPPEVDLRAGCPAIYDQGQLGSCTANAIAGLFEYLLLKEQKEDFIPSRLFIYFNERVLEGTVKSDAGAQIRDGIKTIAKQGVCPEREWPYIIQRFDIKPPTICYKSALKNKALTYHSLPTNLAAYKNCLAGGSPFVFGFTVYESFESEATARTGVVSVPGSNEEMLGGHAVMCVGYDDVKQHFIIRNSWGTGWGDQGYCYFPYDYLRNEPVADFWTVQLVS